MGFFFIIVYYGAWPSIFFSFLLNTAHHNQKLNALMLRLHAEPLQLCFGICNQFSIQQFNQFYLHQLYFLFKYSLFEKLLFFYLRKKNRQLSHLPAIDSLRYLKPQFLNPVWSKAQVPGFNRVVRVNFFLKKLKRRRFSKKKSTGCNRVFDRVLPGQPVGSAGSHRVFSFLFFLQPGPVLALGRPGRVLNLCLKLYQNRILSQPAVVLSLQ